VTTLAVRVRRPVAAPIVAMLGLAGPALGQDTIWSVTGPDDDLFGFVMRGVSDHDGDGIGDLLTSTSTWIGPDEVTLRSGRDGAVLHTWTGGTDQTNFGSALAEVGDLDGDGTPDFGIVDWLEPRLQTSTWSGATWQKLFDVDAKFVMTIEPLGDADSDGHDDFLVGAPPVGGHGAVRWVSGLDGSYLILVPGSAGDRLGAHLARLGDLNGDGFPDVAAGAPQDGVGNGFIRLLDGRSGLTLRDLDAPAGFTSFGAAFEDLGDFDGDGVDDLIVPDPFYESAPGRGDGAYVIVSCADGSILQFEHGAAQDEQLGFSFAALGDVSGDGVPDFMLGRAMRFEITSGRTLHVLYSFPRDYSYRLSSHAPDLDGDGIADIVYSFDNTASTPGVILARAGNDLWMHAEPEEATAGDTVTFTTLERTPGLLTVRVIVEVDGLPTFFLLPPFGSFAADEQRVESFTVPPGLGVHHLVHVALAQRIASGGTIVSGHETLDLD
jgi:hypothetical protein